MDTNTIQYVLDACHAYQGNEWEVKSFCSQFEKCTTYDIPCELERSIAACVSPCMASGGGKTPVDLCLNACAAGYR